ncbi:MAG: DUF6705 family protein [Oceanihabitans sp.]
MMKNILFILLFAFTFLACKAQNPIISLYDGTLSPRLENSYYKDTDNDFNRFIGTWKFTNGLEEFSMILNKKELNVFTNYKNITYYSDYLYGEYQYIDEDGNELVNSLSNITNTSIGVSEHLIFGNGFIPIRVIPRCDDCEAGERRVELSLTDPERDYISIDIILRTVPSITDPSINDLHMIVWRSYSVIPEDAPNVSRIPLGEYIFIKQ